LLAYPSPKKKLYDVAKRLKTKEEEVETYFPCFMAFIDCSAEQPIPPRPTKNWIRRKMYYSGKKKKHTTVKNLLYTSNQKGLIVYKTKGTIKWVKDMTIIYTKRIIRIYQRT
jgi:hypothetical protein